MNRLGDAEAFGWVFLACELIIGSVPFINGIYYLFECTHDHIEVDLTVSIRTCHDILNCKFIPISSVIVWITNLNSI